ncbi:MAG: site-specific DNA-methyltransferase [Clostridia bacterium]|nr:site-specific DNA-methyltransferase [Clostridia bacterium]
MERRINNEIFIGDALAALKRVPDEIFNCCVTSPPYYGLRDYGAEGQIGQEETPEEYIQNLVLIFREIRRTLRKDGVLWVVIADSYSGSGKGRVADGTNCKGVSMSRKYQGITEGRLKKAKTSCKNKDLIGIPWLLAFALRADGWFLRQDIIWQKTNSMPESVRDRCVRSHEYIFMLSKSKKYYFDWDAIKEPCVNTTDREPKFRRKRDVWSMPTAGFRGAHFAAFPEQLAKTCILATCPVGGVVVDPFLGSGTTGKVAKDNGRCFVGIEINKEYAIIAAERTKTELCNNCKHNTRDFVCSAHCGGCNGTSKFEQRKERDEK